MSTLRLPLAFAEQVLRQFGGRMLARLVEEVLAEEAMVYEEADERRMRGG